jgi:hypothetical protein
LNDCETSQELLILKEEYSAEDWFEASKESYAGRCMLWWFLALRSFLAVESLVLRMTVLREIGSVVVLLVEIEYLASGLEKMPVDYTAARSEVCIDSLFVLRLQNRALLALLQCFVSVLVCRTRSRLVTMQMEDWTCS